MKLVESNIYVIPVEYNYWINEKRNVVLLLNWQTRRKYGIHVILRISGCKTRLLLDNFIK